MTESVPWRLSGRPHTLRRCSLMAGLTALGLMACSNGGGAGSRDVNGAGGGGSGLDTRIVIDTDCVTPVLTPDGASGVVRIISSGGEGEQVQINLLEGPAQLEGESGPSGARAVATIINGFAEVAVHCEGYGQVRMNVRQPDGRLKLTPHLLCARPSSYERACASRQAPNPVGDWGLVLNSPVRAGLRRMAPRGTRLANLPDTVRIGVELRFDQGFKPAVEAPVTGEIERGAALGVELSPASTATDPFDRIAWFDLRAGVEPGSVRLKFTAELDGEIRTLITEPFVVTPSPARRVDLTCTPEAPRTVFDAGGGLIEGAGEVSCTLTVAGPDGLAPPEDTRVWVLSEAGTTQPRVRSLDPLTGQAQFFFTAGRRPPVDTAPRGPSPLDGLVTLVAVSEGSEGFDDRDGDGLYTEGVDRFAREHDLSEPWVDANDDGEWNPGETWLDTDGDGEFTPPNGVHDPYAYVWADTRVRWVGPVADEPLSGQSALVIHCEAPHCSLTPLEGFHEHCAPPSPVDPLAPVGYLLPEAVITGEAQVADRNGQCVAVEGEADLALEPEGLARLQAPPVPVGPCALAGQSPTDFELALRVEEATTLTLSLTGEDLPPMSRVLCLPSPTP